MSFDAWCPEPIWEGQDAYIIGGGPSLRSFDWECLRGRNTIGCNSAYLLGPDICKVIFFCDRSFFSRYWRQLQAFKGLVVTNCQPLANLRLPWLKVMRRQTRGLSKGDTIALSFSAGTGAANLALSMGARRVFLLGMDCQAGEGERPNWHDQPEKPVIRKAIYDRFAWGWEFVARALPNVFPGREIIQVSDVVKNSPFPIESVRQHFGVHHGCESVGGGSPVHH